MPPRAGAARSRRAVSAPGRLPRRRCASSWRAWTPGGMWSDRRGPSPTTRRVARGGPAPAAADEREQLRAGRRARQGSGRRRAAPVAGAARSREPVQEPAAVGRGQGSSARPQDGPQRPRRPAQGPRRRRAARADGRRLVSLDPETVAAQRDDRRRQNEERLRAGEAWSSEGDFVFTKEIGEPVHPSALSRLFVSSVRRAGLPTSTTPPRVRPPACGKGRASARLRRSYAQQSDAHDHHEAFEEFGDTHREAPHRRPIAEAGERRISCGGPLPSLGESLPAAVAVWTAASSRLRSLPLCDCHGRREQRTFANCSATPPRAAQLGRRHAAAPDQHAVGGRHRGSFSPAA